MEDQLILAHCQVNLDQVFSVGHDTLRIHDPMASVRKMLWSFLGVLIWYWISRICGMQLGTAPLLKRTPVDLGKNQLSDPYFEMVVKPTVLNNAHRVWQRNDRENYRDISIFCTFIILVLMNVACINVAGNREIIYLSLQSTIREPEIYLFLWQNLLNSF